MSPPSFVSPGQAGSISCCPCTFQLSLQLPRGRGSTEGTQAGTSHCPEAGCQVWMWGWDAPVLPSTQLPWLAGWSPRSPLSSQGSALARSYIHPGMAISCQPQPEPWGRRAGAVSELKALTLWGVAGGDARATATCRGAAGGGHGPQGCGQAWEQPWLLVVGDIVSPCWCWDQLHQHWCFPCGWEAMSLRSLRAALHCLQPFLLSWQG